MKDPRIEKLAYNLINYSIRLQKGEKVLIENFGLKRTCNCTCKRSICDWWFPIRLFKRSSSDRSLLMGATEEHFEQIVAYEASVMKDMDAYIGLRSGDNINEQADVPSERMKVHGQTVGKSS